MLWDIIRDFIVQNITGGSLSDGTIISGGYLGHISVYDINNELVDSGVYQTTEYDVLKIGSSSDASVFINYADWLATTFTIISMCLIVVFAIWLVRWVFKAVSSAFLLRR